jgi:hypothetical protein
MTGRIEKILKQKKTTKNDDLGKQLGDSPF